MRLAVREQGEGSPVVLLHGLFGQARNFGGLQAALAARHRVAAFDLRNHGASLHAAGMRYADMAQDVAETMQAIGMPRAAVLGHSMGGKTAMRLSLDHPGRVTRLVVADIAPTPSPGSFAQYAAAMRRLPLGEGLTRSQATALLEPAVPDAGVRAFLLMNFDFSRACWRIGLEEISAGMDEVLDWQDGAAQYNGPALFVGGARSDYIKPDDHPVILRLFPAAQFATVADAGHWLHADNPAGFLAAISAFLEQS